MEPKELGARLARAREERKLSQEEVADVLGVSRVLVSHWERGERRPPEQVLERLSVIYGVPLPDLLNPEAGVPASDLVDLLYRDAEQGTIDAKARTGLRDFDRFLNAYADLLEALDEPFEPLRASPFRLDSRFMGVQDIRRKALDVRAWLGLDSGPVGDLPALLDQAGVTVLRTPLGPNLRRSVSGAFLNHPRLGFCIAVNLETTPGRQVFTMAHEFSHALLHSQTENHVVSWFGRRDEKERFADAWAGEFLVPTSGLRRATETRGIRSIGGPEDVVHLQRLYRVSYGTMLLRLLQADLISAKQYDRFKTIHPVALAAQLGYPTLPDEWRQDPKRWRLERFPRRFVRLLATALNQGRLSPASAATLTGLTIDEMAELMAPVAGRDPEVAEEIREYEDVRDRAAG